MKTIARLSACAALALLVAACNGKPEDTGDSAPDAGGGGPATTTAPLPASPAWAAPMLGHNIAEITKGAARCTGAFDGVSARHTGAQKGVELRGWGWDETGARTPDRLLIADASGRIVGAGAFGDLRTDVPKALPEVKTDKAGWTASAGVTTGDLQAIAQTANGATCTLGRITL